MNPKERIRIVDFVSHLETLAKNSTDKVVDGFKETEKELLKNSSPKHGT